MEDEVGSMTAADPRFLPVPVTPAVGPAVGPVSAPRRGMSRWIVLGAGALIGLVAGRLSKREPDE